MRTAFPAVSAFAMTLAALSASVGCRAAAPAAVPAVSGEKVPDNADTVAQEAVDAKVTMLLHLDRLQGFRFSKRLVVLGGWDEAIVGTGVDPLTDVHRAFIAAHASHTGDVAIILQHSAPEERIVAGLAALQKEWLAKHPPPPPRDPEPVPSHEKRAESPAGTAAKPASAPPAQSASPEAAGAKPGSPPAAQSASPAAATPTNQGASPAPGGADRRRTDSIRPHPEITLDDEPEPNGSGPVSSDPDPQGSSDEHVYPVTLADLKARLDDLAGPQELPDLSRFPFPAAYRYMKNDFAHIDGPALIAEPHPGLLVVLPPARAFAALRLMEAGGLPGPSEAEAMVFRAWDPETSIQNGPVWSPEVRYAEAVFSFDGWGNSNLKFRAVCTSPAAAKTQAERMTSQVEEAQSISLGGAKLRLFDYIEFHAERDRVKMTTRLLADDVDWIVAMSMKPL